MDFGNSVLLGSNPVVPTFPGAVSLGRLFNLPEPSCYCHSVDNIY